MSVFAMKGIEISHVSYPSNCDINPRRTDLFQEFVTLIPFPRTLEVSRVMQTPFPVFLEDVPARYKTSKENWMGEWEDDGIGLLDADVHVGLALAHHHTGSRSAGAYPLFVTNIDCGPKFPEAAVCNRCDSGFCMRKHFAACTHRYRCPAHHFHSCIARLGTYSIVRLDIEAGPVRRSRCIKAEG